MTKQTVQILNAILMNEKLTDSICQKLVIIEKNKFDSRLNVASGAFLSFDNLTSEDFYEIARYKKGFEIDEERGK